MHLDISLRFCNSQVAAAWRRIRHHLGCWTLPAHCMQAATGGLWSYLVVTMGHRGVVTMTTMAVLITTDYDYDYIHSREPWHNFNHTVFYCVCVCVDCTSVWVSQLTVEVVYGF